MMSCGAIARGDEVTVYPVWCNAESGWVNGKCAGKKEAMPRHVFAVFPESQRVVERITGQAVAPERLEQCVVRDARNWECRKAAFRSRMIDGTWEEAYENGTSVSIRSVSWTEWKLNGGK